MSSNIAVRERPILFTAEMVRAILDGRKSQTRRVVKPQPDPMVWENILDGRTHGAAGYSWLCPNGCRIDPAGAAMLEFSPYQVGMRLWVRETWWMHDDAAAFDASDANCTDADGNRVLVNWDASMDGDSRRIGREYGCRKRSPMFMPRWASRIALEVTGVRVERVQSISDADCLAEGIDAERAVADGIERPYREAYARLWDCINGKKHPWSSNPWVWVITLRRLR